MFRPRWLPALLMILVVPAMVAAEPFRYPEGKHGQGELKYVNGVPVLIVQGTPEEMGEQIGTLALKPAGGGPFGLLKQFLKQKGLDKALPVLVSACKVLYDKFPDDYRKELQAIAKASDSDLDMLIIGNTMVDFVKIGGCSGLIVEAARSKTGGLMYGRNTDLPPLGNLDEYSLLIVYRPKGKPAFATVGFPGGLIGTAGINAAGLCWGQNEVYSAADDSPRFNPKGSPMVPLMRRILDSCNSVADVEKLLKNEQPTTLMNLIICDKNGGTVFEVTTKSVVARPPSDGLGCCTNHFRSKELATDTECRRFTALEESRKMDKLGVAEVLARLNAANQGDATLQTMVFEPSALKMHLALGKKSSAKALKALELEPLFKQDK